MHIKLQSESMKGRDQLGTPVSDGNILKRILKKCGVGCELAQSGPEEGRVEDSREYGKTSRNCWFRKCL
jgi:hypothetical protein